MQKKVPLYQQIMERLKERILEGSFDYDTPFVTEERLTKEFDVSRITAIRALEELEREGIVTRKRGSGSYVTRDAVRLINRNDTEEQTVRIEKRKQGVSLVALVLPFDIKVGEMFRCFEGINSILNKENCFVSIYNAHRNIENEAAILRRLLEQGVDGVISYPVRSGRNFEIYNQFLIEKTPIVLIDNYIENMPVSYVISDNASGTKQLCGYAVKHGHTRIGFISRTRIDFAVSVRDRYMGYTEGLMENGLEVNLDYVAVDLNFKYDSLDPAEQKKYGSAEGYLASAVKRLHDAGVTAVLCQNDWVAMTVSRICRELGISVPDELCIMGFDNQEALNETEGGDKIITVEQDFFEIGVKAGETILKEINGYAPGMGSVVPVKMVANN